jgi:uncharacterized protein YfaA (DUF2138 family)
MQKNINIFSMSLVRPVLALVWPLFLVFPSYAANFNRAPDATINTQSLFDLPKDLVSIPLVKDLLTEDFVFYYRNSGEDWLQFRGALARIAFEHELDWPTQIATWLMNGPAEIALWKGDEGRLNHFMVILNQSALKDLAAQIAKISIGDSQLKAEKAVSGHSAISVARLELPSGKNVFLAAENGRIFIFSDASMTLPIETEQKGIIERSKIFFGAKDEVSVYSPKLGTNKHSLTVSAQYLSFGYQAFIPGLQNLRLDFSKGGQWSASVLTTPEMSPIDAKNWSYQARGAALCFSLPLNLKKVGSIVKSEILLHQMKNNATACWYPESKLYTPVFTVRGDFKELIQKPQELRNIFTNLVGVREAIWLPKESEDEQPKLKYLPMLPVQAAKVASGQIGFTRDIGGRFGLYDSKRNPQNEHLGGKRYFRVKLVVTPELLVFSPDDRLVDNTLKTLDGKFPSMAASMEKKMAVVQVPMMFMSPADLSKLMKNSILESLPASQESIFRTAVSRQFFPNLEKFGKQAPQVAFLKGDKEWKSLEWVSGAN